MSLSRTDDRQGHDRTLELAATAIDFDLARAEADELEGHLATCPTCARRVAALRADARVLSRPITVPALARADATVYAAIARRPVRQQRLLLLAAAALLLVALLGTAAVGAALLRTRDAVPTTVVPTTPVADASPGPDASPSVVGDTWATMDFTEESMGGFVEDATFAGTDLVAVGTRECVPNFDNPTNCYASAWTAALGQSWTRAANQAGLEVGLGQGLGPPASGIHDVVDGPAGLVAIGFDIDPVRSSCRVAPCTTGPGVWRSPDGRTWERALVDFGPSTIDTYSLPISDIAAGPAGYVMVGYAIDYAAPGPSLPARATAWASPDGVTWTRAKDSADMDVGPCVDTGESPDCGGMRAVVAVGSGFLAVGQARTGPEPNGTSRPAAWTSPDGLTWTRSEAGLDFEGLLVDVTVGGPGVVAIGTICQPTCVNVALGVAATSRDGSAWTFSQVAGSTGLESVASVGGQVFAIGVAPQDGAPQEPQLWRSDDGVGWRRATGLPSIPTDIGDVGLAAADDRLVVFGWALGGVTGFRNFSYLSPAPGSPAAPSDPPVAELPTPKCPAPPQQVIPPVFSASSGNGQVVAATRGSYTTITCSTTGTVDIVYKPPKESLSAYPGDTITFTVPVGWRFVSWEGSHSPLHGTGLGGTWQAADLPDRPRSIDLPGPLLSDESVNLTVVLVSDDERSVIKLELFLEVNRSVS